jgi:hypothetical protein
LIPRVCGTEGAEDVGNEEVELVDVGTIEDVVIAVDEAAAANEAVDEVDGAADWTDEDVGTIDEDVETTDELADVVDIIKAGLLVVWEVETVIPNSYISNSDGPPQYSEWFPGQIISHPVPSRTRAPPFSTSLPHQHSIIRLAGYCWG